MKKHNHTFIFAFIILAMAASCKKDDAVQSQQTSKLTQSTIIGVNGPISGIVNQELYFSLVWANSDDSAEFDHLQDSSANNTRFIKLFALTNAVDTSSTVSKNIKPVIYTFKAATPGIYFLKFYKTGNTDNFAIVDTLNIK